MIQTFFIILYIVISTIFLGILAILLAFFDKSGNSSHKIARAWAKSILFVSRIKVVVKGLSNIDPASSYIYMANHLSNFDIPVLLACLPVQFRWLAKAELFKIPIFGQGMQGCGYISIDRSNRKEAFKSLDIAAEKIRNGVSVVIFPEGTRSREFKVNQFKKGGFVLAVDAQVPIIPILIDGTWHIMSKNGLRIKPGKVFLEIMEPVETSEYSRKTKNDLMEKVRRIISSSFEESTKDQPLC